MKNVFDYVGETITKKTSRVNQAMIKDNKVRGFVSAEPQEYILIWNENLKYPHYIADPKSLNKANKQQQTQFNKRINKLEKIGYKLYGKVFHSIN